MPSRRRPKSASASPAQPTSQPPISPGLRPASRGGVEVDLERFAAALKESTRADKAVQQQRHQERKAAVAAAETAAEHERSLVTARRDLERAVAAVRNAKQQGRGRAEADEQWKVAKARVIELETGAPPAWAPAAPEPDVEVDADTHGDAEMLEAGSDTPESDT